ncbi:GT1Gtflike [Aspergillus affinis]|uniref:GT1Gtflike n=1 Tax=Aspergillus affinis TaxID=1070780 RepID=UPI0022FF207E|nr:UDP-glycosyltransferase family protein [Aspergillus affinis]KAI9045877.1 GT1Gtflike [Aspergillus affinis]
MRAGPQTRSSDKPLSQISRSQTWRPHEKPSSSAQALWVYSSKPAFMKCSEFYASARGVHTIITTDDPERHRAMRNTALPLFASREMDDVFRIGRIQVKRAADSMMQSSQEGKPVDLLSYFKAMMINITAGTYLCSKELVCYSAPNSGWMTAHNFVDGYRWLMLHLENEIGQSLSRSDVSSLFQQAAVFLIAGKSPSITLTIACFYILKSPRIKDRLQTELDEFDKRTPGGISGPQLDWRALTRLAYLDAVVKESLRIVPPIPGLLPRVVPTEGMEIGPYFLPVGARISGALLAFHHNETVFPNPGCFNPERWLQASPDELQAMEQHFMPFSKGSRACIGLQQAYIYMFTALAHIWTQFDMEAVERIPETLDWKDQTGAVPRIPLLKAKPNPTVKIGQTLMVKDPCLHLRRRHFLLRNDHDVKHETATDHNVQVEFATPSIKLNIVIQTIGTQGDIQPFLVLGDELVRQGHRVRIATHATYASAIATGYSQLEFFSIGGDPAELISYGRKNSGYVHELKTLQARLQGKKIPMMSDIISGCWRSCVDDDPDTGAPFVADAIIASPIVFSHVHCAQALGAVPVHLMYTMPWSRTRMFPHAITRVGVGRAMKPGRRNWISYVATEWMVWLYLGDTINQLRVSLDLAPVPMKLGSVLHETLKIPFTYFWPPSLVPKPDDWPAHIGNVALYGPCGWSPYLPSHEPSPELQEFLRSGSTPVYIGFGSIVLDEQQSQELTDTVMAAISLAGIRAFVGKGWCKLGSLACSHKNVLFIDDCPHEWLFQHVSAVVHHGGIGTTICGLKHDRPTVVVPFVADQRFWGHIVAGTGAGPAPIPYTSLTPRRLAAAMRHCLTDQAKAAARQVGTKLRAETRGTSNAVQSFYRNLPLRRMRCDYLFDQPAVWSYGRANEEIQLSKAAAWILICHGRIRAQDLKIYQINPYGALDCGTSRNLVTVIIGVFVRVLSALWHAVLYLLGGRTNIMNAPPRSPASFGTEAAVVKARLREGQYVAEKMSSETQSVVLGNFDASCGKDRNLDTFCL